MLKHTVRVSELRMSDADPSGTDKPPYNVAGNLLWSFDQKQVEMSMLNGPMSRGLLRQLLSFLKRKGVELIIADRAGSHTLPLAHLRSDGRYEMRVDELAGRFMPAGDTDWMPLPED